MNEPAEIKLEPLGNCRWRVPRDQSLGMRVPGEIIATEDMLPAILKDQALRQVVNVATLPGIVGASLAMPDIHWGYGFPIGGVAAFDLDEGVISPGGVGYDINCGVCLVRSNLRVSDLTAKIPKLVESLFEHIPCGVGSEGNIHLSEADYDRVLTEGARWVVEQGLAEPADLNRMEERGMMRDADPSLVSPRARERARNQLGTLGSGNHFLEIQEVAEVFDAEIAEKFGLFPGQLTVMIHSGSRGLGHQICDETLKVMQGVVRREGWTLPDRQLACAPIKSREGQDYLAAMRCAANFAWANRLAMVGLTRRALAKTLGTPPSALEMHLVWDVAHNIAKIEPFTWEGRRRQLCVHRKGATRAFGPGHPDLPDDLRLTGQPVLIPGDMGRASFVLVGCTEATAATFSSTCHGAGRVLSRKAALQSSRGKDITRLMQSRGVVVRARSRETLGEEIPEAYKDVSAVVDAVDGAGISRKVARLKPVGTVKG